MSWWCYCVRVKCLSTRVFRDRVRKLVPSLSLWLQTWPSAAVPRHSMSTSRHPACKDDTCVMNLWLATAQPSLVPLTTSRKKRVMMAVLTWSLPKLMTPCSSVTVRNVMVVLYDHCSSHTHSCSVGRSPVHVGLLPCSGYPQSDPQR